MRKTKRMRIYSVIVVAIGGVGLLSTAAQATLPAPEFLRSHKPITSTTFTDSSGFGQIEVGSTTLTWSGATAKGVLESPDKVAKVVLTFTGDKIGSCEVNSPGAGKGEVVTRELRGVLGYIAEAGPVVGVLFEPASGSTFLEVEKSKCSPALEVTGSIIGKVAPINEETTRLKATFGISSKKQEVTKFEGELTEHQLNIGELDGAFECKEGITTAEKVEIKT